MDTIEKLQQGDQEVRLMQATKKAITTRLLAEYTAKIKRELLVTQGALADARIAAKAASTPPEVDKAECDLQSALNSVADYEGQLRCLEI
jgi:hypothetical protein